MTFEFLTFKAALSVFRVPPFFIAGLTVLSWYPILWSGPLRQTFCFFLPLSLVIVSFIAVIFSWLNTNLAWLSIILDAFWYFPVFNWTLWGYWLPSRHLLYRWWWYLCRVIQSKSHIIWSICSSFRCFAISAENFIFFHVLVSWGVASGNKNHNIFRYWSSFCRIIHILMRHILDWIVLKIPVMSIYSSFLIEWLLTNVAVCSIGKLFNVF